MSDFVEQLLTLYGPLGFGWVMYLFERRRVVLLSDRAYQVATENMRILTELSAELQTSTQVLVTLKDKFIELVAQHKQK